jgi:tetratricopeptide (TPR) repeat protein
MIDMLDAGLCGEASVATKRVRAQLGALREPKYENGIVVLELVRQAYRLLDDKKALEPGTSYRNALRDIFKCDRMFLTSTLERRLGWAGVASEPERFTRMDEKTFYELVSSLYDLTSVKRLAAIVATPGLKDLAEQLEGEPRRQKDLDKRLPIDRRSLLCIFLAAARLEDADISSALFKSRRKGGLAPPRPLLDPLREMARDIGIRRFFTTNYDLEIENLFMFDDLRERDRLPVADKLEKLENEVDFECSMDGAALVRRRTNGDTVRSDVNDGRHTAPLLEFALGNTQSVIHIYHHHGRVDLPKTMVAADGEYNRMYRAEGLNRSSLDRAYDVMIEGNPILFVGSGLTEIELTRTLRHKVSNAHARQSAPVFVFRAADGTPKDLLKEQLNLLTKLGVQVIHYGHPRRGGAFSLRRHLILLDSIADGFGLPQTLKDEWRPLTPNRRKEQPLPVGAATPIEYIENNYRLIFDLDFDRCVVAWMLSSEGKLFAERIKAKGKEEMVAGQPDPLAPSRLITEYLSMLGTKLNTAALRHELRQIAGESKKFFIAKATPVDPRRRTIIRSGRAAHRHLSPPGLSSWRKAEGESPAWTPEMWEWRPLRDVSETAAAVYDVRTQPGYADELRSRLEQRQVPLRQVVVGPRGSGKGAFLKWLAASADEAGRADDCLILNCSHGQEVDSAISLIRDFLYRPSAAPPGRSRREQILAFMEEGAPVGGANAPRPLLILGAVDRLFGSDNKPIGAEFDWLLTRLFDPRMPVDIVVTASLRCEAYFAALIQRFSDDGTASCEPSYPERMVQVNQSTSDEMSRILGIGYLRALNEEVEKREQESAVADPFNARVKMTQRHPEMVVGRAIQGLQNAAPGGIGPLTQEIIKTIAFIGLPVEAEVLLCAPQVRRQLQSLSSGSLGSSPLPSGKELIADRITRRNFIRALAFAFERGLLRAIEPYDDDLVPASCPPEWSAARKVIFAIRNRNRFVLHRLVSQVMRDRFGVPNSETVLSNSFNLSLYASQPDDAPASEPNVTNALEQLVDNLMNAWRDSWLHPELRGQVETLRNALLDPGIYSSDALVPELMARLRKFERLLRMLDPMAPAAMRAAGGVIRGFFSSVNLLGHDIGDPRSRVGDMAVLTAHKGRIRLLLDFALEAQAVRQAQGGLAGFLNEKIIATPIVAADPSDRGGEDSDYEPQKLKIDEGNIFSQWKLAPLGGRTVETILSDLVGKAAEMEKVGNSVPYRDRLLVPARVALLRRERRTPTAADLRRNLQLRPFYEEEIVWLLNERGMLSLAQGDLYTATTAFNMAIDANGKIEAERYHPNRCRLLLNRSLLWIERGKIAEARRTLTELQIGVGSTPDALSADGDEGQLIRALAAGYLGLCDQLNGLSQRAEAQYRKALKALTRLRELRSVAIFELHLGSLLQARPRGREESARCYGRAIEAAEGGRHSDILYRIRVSQVQNDWTLEKVEAPDALEVLRTAVDYGQQLDMHRVTVQALSASMQMRLKLGDVESASFDCARALAIATQYGMSLRRIYLRGLTGKVYQARGDYANARFVFERTIEAAERIGYQRAIELSSMELVKLPRR